MNMKDINIKDIPHFNEACANCGQSADMHTTPPRHDCVGFVRYDPPRAAYGVAYWESPKLMAIHVQQYKDAAERANRIAKGYR